MVTNRSDRLDIEIDGAERIQRLEEIVELLAMTAIQKSQTFQNSAV